MKKKIGYYLADFSPDKTKSIGIMKVTTEILKRIIKNKELEITLILTDKNKHLFENFNCKKEVVLSSKKSEFINKMFYLPKQANEIAKKNKLEILFFPKGHIPFFKSENIKYYSFIHDLIPFYYLKKGHLNFLPVCILLWNSMKKSDKIFTNSEYSKSQIKKHSKKGILVVPLGVNLVKPKKPSLKKDSFIFLIGNKNPHKNLDLGEKILKKYNEKSKKKYKIFTSNGKLTNEELAGYYSNAKLSIFLSDIEGFGLPMIESYVYNTPIVFNNKTSLAEVGKNLKGKCDVKNEKSIFEAIDEILKISKKEIMEKRKELLEKYNWNNGSKVIFEGLVK